MHSCILAQMFLKHTYKDWKVKFQQLNTVITASEANTKKFTHPDFLIMFGLIIGTG
jgi:hypothetical protein